MSRILFTARPDLKPKCPYCQMELEEIYFKVVWKFFLALSANGVFFCPYCLKVFGCGQSRP